MLWQFLSTPKGGSLLIAVCAVLILHYIGNRGHTRGGQVAALLISVTLILVLRAVKAE